MRVLSRRMLSWVLLGTALAVSSVLGASRPAGAVEVGEPAPPFTMASTTGGDISLNDFRGKKWVRGNITGVAFLVNKLVAKRLELLDEVAPKPCRSACWSIRTIRTPSPT
jgi:hypothetical protein